MTSALAIQRQRAEAVARAIVERLPGGAVRAVFAGGSLGRGEVWAARIGECLEIYSDVDLYVVIDDAARRAEVLAAARSAAAALAPPPHARFLRGIDTGVYTPDDLRAQPVRPGTADLGYRHLLLHGDSAVLRDLGAAMARPMQPVEALYLLENRALELACADLASSAGMQRLGVVSALKCRLDAGTAHLIADGRFSSLSSDREEQLATAPPATLAPAERAAVAAAFAASRSLEDYLRGRDTNAEAADALRLIGSSWRALAAKVLGGSPEEPAALVARRCSSGHWAANGREVVRLRHAAGWSMGRAIREAVRLRRYAPRTTLRTRALVEEIERSRPAWSDRLHAHAVYVDRLTGAVGIHEGTLTRRACAAYRALTRES